MHEATEDLTLASTATADLAADITRAASWAGEPFLHPGEEPDRALAPGTARRRAFDDALEEIDSGRSTPSSRWKVRYGLMLGLERVLSDKPPRLASGTELRRHQIDALAGMLTELIAANQQPAENGNGNGAPRRASRTRRKRTRSSSSKADDEEDEAEPELRPRRIRARNGATGSGIRPPPARRSPPPGSSRPRARSAS